MRVLITGGAGYVGSVLCEEIRKSYLARMGSSIQAVILDTWLYRPDEIEDASANQELTPTRISGDYPTQIKRLRGRLGLTQVALAECLGVSFPTVNRWENGKSKPSQLSWQQLMSLAGDGDESVVADIRDEKTFRDAVEGCDAVIHLACVSNDPSFDLDPDLGKSVNLECLPAILRISKESGVKHFIYASSSSVYGVKPKSLGMVTETAHLDPLTDYSLCKMKGEELVMNARESCFATTILRPATVCGRSPRQRLDLVHNIFARNAAEYGGVSIFGGEQYRPGIHIRDMCRLYVEILKIGNTSPVNVDGKIWNAGWENKKVKDIADMAADVTMEILGKEVFIGITPSDDNRSYRVSSIKLTQDLGFVPKYSVRDAMVEVVHWVEVASSNQVSLDDPIFHNIKMVEEHGIGA